MPFIPSTFDRLILRVMGGPTAVLDLIGAAGLKAFLVARYLGVVDALAASPGSANQLAHRLELDQDRLQPLLRLLSSVGYLRQSRGVYRLTRSTKRWLTSGSEPRVGDFLRLWDRLVLGYWDETLEDTITEKSAPDFYHWIGHQPEGWSIAQAGFEATAGLILPAFVKAARVPSGPARLLDAGGGHGLYSIALCKEHDDLTCDIFDLPEALGRAKTNVTAAGLSHRVQLRPGDLTTDHLGQGYDIVLLANVVHGFGPATNIDLLRRVGEALREGGSVVILDQFGKIPGRLGNAVNAMLDLAYVASGEGRSYKVEEVKGWLGSTGFSRVEHRPLRRVPGNGLIVAVRQGHPPEGRTRATV